MTQPLRIAAVGCGLAARQLHVPAIAALPGTELVGLCDRDLEAARKLAGRAAGDPLCTDDVSKLLAEARADVVLVLTPTETHERLTGQALDAGAHVLVEKPFAARADAARRMADAASRAGRLLSVVHNELFTPGMQQLRRRLSTGAVGEISSVHYLTSSRNQRYVPDAWYFEARGGRMGETLPHALCILDELMPQLEIVSAQARHLGHAILPDWANDWAKPSRELVDDLRVELQTPDRSGLASIWYSMNSHVPTSVLVCGSEGHLLAYPFGGVTQLRTVPPPMSESIRALRERVRRGFERRLRRARGRRPQQRIEDSSHYAQLAHFFAAVRGEQTLRADAESACRVTALWEGVVDRIEAEQAQ